MIFYRAHELSGNTGFIDTLCAAITERGGTPLPVYCSSLRSADPGLADLLRPASAIITTVLAAGGSSPPARAPKVTGTRGRSPGWASRSSRACA